jgi:hypothetical protein
MTSYKILDVDVYTSKILPSSFDEKEKVEHVFTYFKKPGEIIHPIKSFMSIGTFDTRCNETLINLFSNWALRQYHYNQSLDCNQIIELENFSNIDNIKEIIKGAPKLPFSLIVDSTKTIKQFYMSSISQYVNLQDNYEIIDSSTNVLFYTIKNMRYFLNLLYYK